LKRACRNLALLQDLFQARDRHHVLDPPLLAHELPDVYHADVRHVGVYEHRLRVDLHRGCGGGGHRGLLSGHLLDAVRLLRRRTRFAPERRGGR
jgi:hypothetical protein